MSFMNVTISNKKNAMSGERPGAVISAVQTDQNLEMSNDNFSIGDQTNGFLNQGSAVEFDDVAVDFDIDFLELETPILQRINTGVSSSFEIACFEVSMSNPNMKYLELNGLVTVLERYPEFTLEYECATSAVPKTKRKRTTAKKDTTTKKRKS